MFQSPAQRSVRQERLHGAQMSLNSLERLIGILDVFEEAPGVFTADQLHARLGYTRSTLYRYLKTLSDAGLLTSYHGSGFMLGPRVIELHAAMMTRDPLILMSRGLMQALSRRFKGTSQLCRRFRSKVLCVHQEAANDIAGVPIPFVHARTLVCGAASRVILANLAAPQLRRVYEDNPQLFSGVGMGDDLLQVRRCLRRIRERGFEVGAGDHVDGVTTVAAPVLDGGAIVIGSLCLTIAQSQVQEARIAAIAEEVMQAAEIVSHALAA